MTSSTTKTKNKRKNKSFASETNESKQLMLVIFKSFVVGIVSLFIILSIFSLIMVKYDYSEKSVPIMAIISAVLAAFIAGFWSTKRIKKKGLITGVITNIPLAIIMIIFVAIASDGSIGSLATITALLMIIFGGVGGILAVNSKGKRKIK